MIRSHNPPRLGGWAEGAGLPRVLSRNKCIDDCGRAIGLAVQVGPWNFNAKQLPKTKFYETLGGEDQ
jgi:hypothetical protein